MNGPEESRVLSVSGCLFLKTCTSFLVCCNKLRQTRCLKTVKSYFPRVLEARSLKSGCWQGRAPSKSSRGDSVLASSSFWGLLVSLLPCLLYVVSSSCLSVSPPIIEGHLSLDLGDHLDIQDDLKILNYICKDQFPK